VTKIQSKLVDLQYKTGEQLELLFNISITPGLYSTCPLDKVNGTVLGELNHLLSVIIHKLFETSFHIN